MEYSLRLSKLGASAVHHCMVNTKYSGRTEMRHNSHIVRAVKTDCANVSGEDQFTFKDGALALDEKDFKYLKQSAEKLVDAGQLGGYSEAYTDLWDAIEDAEKRHDVDSAVKAAEKAAANGN